MSLISLLIALAAERYLSSPYWQFATYYNYYLTFTSKTQYQVTPWKNTASLAIFVALPVVVASLLLYWIDDAFFNFVLSTVLLIVCFGCVKTRDSYKKYLMAAFRGDLTSSELTHQQLQEKKNLPDLPFGQLLVWLNYRYFIAIMMFFVAFGAPGVIFYRLLTTVVEGKTIENVTVNKSIQKEAETWLFAVDWLSVRVVAFGYMLVGHFSKALPVWFENIFDMKKPPCKVLNEVAVKSEDFMIDENDCTAEPCLLVRLAKRTLLLCLAVIALLILTGVIS